ncbi:MAG: 3-oxoacyl-[acyl-carrier protein] reductase [bacterium]|jgi:3-oxoacyl-[acyl-carrier protein] reductase
MNILITGGASGLGKAITEILAGNKNNTVYFTYSKSKEKAEEIKSFFENTISIKCDFSEPSELLSLQDRVKEMDLDVLINNAYSGKINQMHFHKYPPIDFLKDFTDNIIPTITITQAAIKWFRKKKKGKIITILSSGLINVPPTGMSSYIANKAYLEKLTKCWANENSKFNITSNSVSPSFMKAALTDDFDDRIVEQMTLNHPNKKLITTNEVAESVMFLTKAGNHINGVDLLMNAGVNIK